MAMGFTQENDMFAVPPLVCPKDSDSGVLLKLPTPCGIPRVLRWFTVACHNSKGCFNGFIKSSQFIIAYQAYIMGIMNCPLIGNVQPKPHAK